MRQSLILLQGIGPVVTHVGEPIRGPGWFGGPNGPTTFSLRLSGFTGMIKIQGALVGTPTEADWFAIPVGGQSVLTYGPPHVTKTFGWTLPLNVTVLRAIMDRSNIFKPPLFKKPPSEHTLAKYGRVEWLLVNF